MYHTKKIGVFISHIFGHYQKHVCQGIIDKALEYGYTAEIFSSMDGENLGLYGIGEESILRIPNYEDLDGIIFASDTYLSTELKDKIQNTLQQKCSCPIIEIAVTNQHFPAIVLENNSTTGKLTEHLITKHNYKRICYLGSKDETYFSDSREQFYRAALEKHGLSCTPDDVFLCTYDNRSAKEALDFFTKDRSVDAVVCYNDRMALLFMAAALSAGYKIPEDIAITGCDNTEEGHNISPTLTTVSFPVYELGAVAVEQLLNLMHGKTIGQETTVLANIMLHNSCGCNNTPERSSIFFEQQLTKRIAKLETSILESMSMSAAFQHISDIDDGADLLEKYIHEIEHCKEFYLCLYGDWDSLSSHILEITDSEEVSTDSEDTILLKLAIRDGKRLPECSFRKNSLLPDHIYKNSECAYIFTPLFFENKEFGYIALSYENNQIDYHFQLVHWLMNINRLIQSICDAKRTGLLVSRLEDIYMKDALTGLLNKHGYNHYEPQLLERAIVNQLPLSCFLFDLDGLKQINDNFGHNEGDFAIQVLGQALEKAVQESDLCARFSGDEFYLLSCNYSEKEAEEFINGIQKYLDNYNRLSSKEYNISVSSGFACEVPSSGYSADNIQQLFSTADEHMYEIKKHKKKNILR